uniref:Uncharacterized protein n=1 Tax=Ralstonia syzygii R24 TaxID=907261 RepID=G3AAS6_9RALS|nr:hypothetical protein RALSY_mp30820 [Ralstonia syzygii R24]
MAGGKISGLHVRATAPAPANAGVPEPQQTPEPQQPGGRRVARSAELEGLAALPSPQAPASPVSAGQMRRAPLPLPAPAAEVPLEPLSAPAAEVSLEAAVIAEKKAVETALKRGAIWQKLGGGAEMTPVRQLKLARDGLVSAKAGLAALDPLTKHAVVDEADEARAQLMGYLAMAAISGIETYKHVLNEALKLERPQSRHASAQRESVCPGRLSCGSRRALTTWRPYSMSSRGIGTLWMTTCDFARHRARQARRACQWRPFCRWCCPAAPCKTRRCGLRPRLSLPTVPAG